MHRNPANTNDSLCSGTKRLLTFWVLGFLTWGERDTQFLLCWLFLHLTQQCAAHPVVPNWTGLAQAQKSTRLFQRQISTNCFFQKSPKFSAHHFRAWHHFLSGVFIMTFVIVTSSAHEHEHLHSMCAPAHALSQTVLSLTKQNDKM